MKKLENIAYGSDSEAQALDLYLPDGDVCAVFLYLHGGGIEKGDKQVGSRYAPYLTERGIAIASANYRMYPDAKYPEFICDAAQAVAWVNTYMRENLNCDKLFVGGSSAGGYLTMMLCFDPHYLADVGLDNSAIAGYLHDAGQPTAHFNVLKHEGIDPRRIVVDESAPLYFIGTQPEYPPMRFIVSDNDMKNRYEQTMLVLSTLNHFGYKKFDHVLMNGRHCAYLGRVDEDGEYLYAKMIYDFMTAKWESEEQ